MKNADRIQRLFSEMASAFAACIAGADLSTLNVDLSRHAHIQYGDFVFPQPFAVKLFQVWNLAVELLEVDAAWSKESLFDLFVKYSIEVARGVLSRVDIAGVSSRFLIELSRQPTEFEKQIAVFGLDGIDEPMKFGLIKLVQLQHTPPFDQAPLFIKGNPVSTAFASIRVIAIDDQTAQAKARLVLASHLSVLNALCAEHWPSYFKLSDFYIDQMDLKMIGVVLPSGEWGGSTTRTRAIYPLPSEKLRSIIDTEPAKRASLAMASNNEVSRGIRAGYEIAGNACTTADPSTAFVLFAIALESSVMGGNSTEITHQLAMRVAHLVSNTLREREATAKRVKNLYKTRSKIVHRGETDVTNHEVNELRILCLDSLRELADLAESDHITQNVDVAKWFEMRLLQ